MAEDRVSDVVPADEDEGPVVVGIGSSAGGLAALQRLFDAMPGDSGLAFVVVVHLSPEHESHLADLLQGHSTMPVTQVFEPTALEADHVYVIPPGRNLNTIDSHLRLSDLERDAHSRAPIDHFFRTLSETHEHRAIGIVLTGTGSDGSLGLQAIKEHGGITLVQDPEEAEFDGMPRNAIASGFADRILRLDEIPAHVVTIAKTATRVEVPDDGGELSEDAQRSVQKILAVVRARTGHDMVGYKRTTLLRRLRRRMQLHHRERLDDYLQLLHADPAEAGKLFDDLLISVTSFFRDAAVFDHLEREIIPSILQGKGPGDSVRVWIVGCSTGEEAYSMAMLLMEAAGRMDQPPLVQIFATDLHDSSLLRAREGVYPEQIESDVSPARLRRFFTRLSDGSYRVNKEVRENVIFAPHNLLRDPPFSHLDLVSCRNLLIYLQRDVQRNVIDLFHYALDPGGHLLLGSSETIDRSTLFVPVHKTYCLFRRRDVSAPEPRLPVFSVRGNRAPHEFDRVLASTTHVRQGFGRLHEQMVERYAPPSVLVNDDQHILHFSAHAGEYLKHPGGEPTNDLLRLVREELRIELRAALYTAKETKAPATSKPVDLKVAGTTRTVVVRVSPAVEDDGLRGLQLVIFDDVQTPAAPPALPSSAGDATTIELETELDLTKQRLQALIEEHETSQEEMKASSEEMQSTNEELRSTLEELETSKEELQSVNEELTTLNQENRHKVEELRLLSSDLQNLLVGTDIATLFLDRHLRILRFTPRVGDLFNIRLSDRGRPLSDLTHQLGDEDIHDDAGRVLDTLVPVEREVQSADGRWFLMRVLPYRTTDDRIEGIVVTFVDITRRRDAEVALSDSEARLRQALEASEMGAWSWDLTDDSFISDRRTRTLFGVSATGDIRFEDLLAGVESEDRRRLRSEIDRSTSEGSGFGIEIEVDRGSSPAWVRFSGRAYWPDDVEHAHPVSRLAGTVLDVTAQKQTEQSLSRRVAEQTAAIRQTERRFRALVEASSQVVWTTDSSGMVVEDSSQWREFTGQSVEQMRGKGWLQAVHPMHRELVERSWDAAVTEHTQFDVEFQLRHAPDAWRWVTARTVPVHDVGGTLLGWVGMVADIDERRRAEERIRALASTLTMAEHEERRRIAQLLHDDLQQRLYSIQMRIGLLRDRSTDAAAVEGLREVEELLQGSVDATHHLTVGLSPPILQHEGFADALGWLSTQMQDMHGLQVEVRSEQAWPLENVDMQVFLFQIVRELLFNVVKHAEVDHAVVELSAADGLLCIDVRDEGVGFDTEILRDGAVTTGLGLASAEERLALFGGTIDIDAAPGSGTSVTIGIPYERPT